MSHVELRGLAKSYGGSRIFEAIDLDIERGEMCVLVGPSGCGKTTLLRAVAGLVAPDAGTIAIAGRDVTRAAPKERGVGMVFQHYALFPNMSVEQNLAFGLEQKRVAAPEIRRRVTAMIELMDLGPRAKAKPHTLSGGQKQRVALARALVLEPQLLLLDEPMSALDAQIRKRLREELKRLQRRVGFTAMFVTHDQEEALIIGDRIAVMDKGRFAQVGTAQAVYSRPANRTVAGFIGDFNVLEPEVVERLFGWRPTATCAVHPQALTIAAPSAIINGNLGASMTIAGRQMLGAVVRYWIASGDIRLKADALNNPSVPPLLDGSPVTVTIAKENLCELAKD